ncbi:MAG TPA: ABC transporter substrate-binding protein [Chromatiales bacterium]|nr:ABC transporter substrate-binding protein [Chromatiales bacterium]
MPTLILNTNLHIDAGRRADLCARLSRFTAEATRKPEQWVMTLLNDARPMTFAGSDASCAFVEFKSVGLPEADMPGISAGLSELLRAELGLDPARVYIEFASSEPQCWGWNGATF